MIVTFVRQEENESSRVKRFWAMCINAKVVDLAIVRWSKAYSKKARSNYGFMWRKENRELLKVRDQISETLVLELLKTGNPTRLSIELPEVIHEIT